MAQRQGRGRQGVSGKDEKNDAARADELRRAVAGVTGFELRRQVDGTYQIVWMSALTGDALPYEDDMTLDDVESWVRENASEDQQQQQ